VIKVSIILPVFNAEKYLGISIASILKQTFDNFELIIINDGSTDSTIHIIYSFQDKRIRVINKEENEGYVKALNEGLKIANGEFIARLDADDSSHPDRLQKQVQFLEYNKEYGLVGSYVIDFEGNPILNSFLDSVQLKLEFLFKNPFVHSSIMFRKELIRLYEFKYDELLTYAEDYKLWFEISKVSELAIIPDVLTKYRKHESQVSYKFKETQKKRFQQINTEIWEHYLGRVLNDIEKDILIYKKLNSSYGIKLLNEFIYKFNNEESVEYFQKRFINEYIVLRKFERFHIFRVSGLSFRTKFFYMLNLKGL
jgi:glycosyltransferase involved in cell wall biosynthesis